MPDGIILENTAERRSKRQTVDAHIAHIEALIEAEREAQEQLLAEAVETKIPTIRESAKSRAAASAQRMAGLENELRLHQNAAKVLDDELASFDRRAEAVAAQKAKADEIRKDALRAWSEAQEALNTAARKCEAAIEVTGNYATTLCGYERKVGEVHILRKWLSNQISIIFEKIEHRKGAGGLPRRKSESWAKTVEQFEPLSPEFGGKWS